MHNTAISMHIILSSCTLVMIAFAGFQAILLLLQDYFLKHKKHTMACLSMPIETLEKYLFRTLILAWVALTAVCISGLLCFEHLFMLPLEKKTMLTLVAWIALSLLLLSRYQWGIRGRLVAQWTLISFFLLLIVYYNIF